MHTTLPQVYGNAMAYTLDNDTRKTRQRPSLIVVDDESEQRSQIVDCLSDLDCELLEAGDGEHALALIALHAPDIVIMDIRMPVKDGVSVVDELERTVRGPQRPKIILMTGDPSSLENAYMRRPDVFTIIEKPIPLRVLRRFVIDALGLVS